MLPAMSEEVLKKSGDIPVIVVSAKADIDDKVKMLKWCTGLYDKALLSQGTLGQGGGSAKRTE